MLLLALGVGLFVSASSIWAPNIMHNSKLGILLLIFGLYAFGRVAEGFFHPAMIVYNRFKTLLIYPLVYGVVLFMTIIGLAIVFEKNLKIIFIGISLLSAVSFLVSIILTKKFLSIKRIFDFNVKNYKSQLAYGIPLGLTSIIGLLAWEFDKLIVSIKFSPELYAVYVLGAAEIPFIRMIRSSVNKVILPEMSKVYAEGNLKELTRLWHSSIRKISLVLLPIFVIAMIFSHEIITLLYSEKFASSVPYFRIYLLLLLVRIASYGTILQAIGKTKDVFKLAIFFMTVNGVLNIILVFTLGLIGPAIATVIATFLNALAAIYVIKKHMQFSFSDALPWISVLKNLGLAVAAGIVVIPILWSNWPDLSKMLVAGIFYLGVYLFLIVLFGLLTDADKRLVRIYFRKLLSFARIST